MTYQELAKKIKAKYPQYNNLGDKELVLKIKKAYPNSYRDVEVPETYYANLSTQEAQRLKQLRDKPELTDTEKAIKKHLEKKLETAPEPEAPRTNEEIRNEAYPSWVSGLFPYTTKGDVKEGEGTLFSGTPLQGGYSSASEPSSASSASAGFQRGPRTSIGKAAYGLGVGPMDFIGKAAYGLGMRPMDPVKDVLSLPGRAVTNFVQGMPEGGLEKTSEEREGLLEQMATSPLTAAAIPLGMGAVGIGKAIGGGLGIATGIGAETAGAIGLGKAFDPEGYGLAEAGIEGIVNIATAGLGGALPKSVAIKRMMEAIKGRVPNPAKVASEVWEKLSSIAPSSPRTAYLKEADAVVRSATEGIQPENMLTLFDPNKRLYGESMEEGIFKKNLGASEGRAPTSQPLDVPPGDAPFLAKAFDAAEGPIRDVEEAIRRSPMGGRSKDLVVDDIRKSVALGYRPRESADDAIARSMKAMDEIDYINNLLKEGQVAPEQAKTAMADVLKANADLTEFIKYMKDFGALPEGAWDVVHTSSVLQNLPDQQLFSGGLLNSNPLSWPGALLRPASAYQIAKPVSNFGYGAAPVLGEATSNALEQAVFGPQERK